jgi:hypothetical protein
MTFPCVQQGFTLPEVDEWYLEEINKNIALEAFIERQTPSLADIDNSPLFRYNPVFLRKFPSQERSAETLAKIVAAVEAILAHPRLGLNMVQTERIARIAGVSIGTFYRYFEDEIALLDFIFPERIVYRT